MNAALSYIAIEGPIGAGKTSLAHKLADDFSARLVLEQVDGNPFLERFYRDPKTLGLPTQLYFLTTRVQRLQFLRQEDIFSNVSISDFLLDKDRLFAEMILDDEQLNLYGFIYEKLTEDLIKPDLVVYLQAPVEVLMQRIQKRGRSFERLIERRYLEDLNSAYIDFFHHYQDAPLLIINVGEIDFVKHKADYRRLIERIAAMRNTMVRSGRYYYNPAPYELT